MVVVVVEVVGMSVVISISIIIIMSCILWDGVVVVVFI